MAVKRKTSVKVSKEEKPLKEIQEAKSKIRKFSLKSIPKRIFLLIGSLIIVIALLFYFKSLFIAAMVNNQPISRLSVIRNLEKQGGKQALNSLITKALIFQEAKKRNIVVGQEEVDAEISNIEKNVEKQGQKLDQLLATQGMTKEELREQVSLQKILEKMVGEVKVTDKEITQYLQDNKDSIPQNMSEKELKDNSATQLKQQKTSDKIQAFVKDLQKNAKIDYLVQY